MMNDLMEQLRDCCLGEPIQEVPRSFFEGLQDALEAKDKRIKELHESCAEMRGRYSVKCAENERLRAVYEAAKAYSKHRDSIRADLLDDALTTAQEGEGE